MALIAVSAMAVESTNIVGYLDKALGEGEYTWACSTFTGIGGQSVSFTLGQFIPNANFAAFGDNIQFCDAEGNWESQLTYASQAFMTENELEGYTVGWYRLSDEEMETCLNSTVVPFAKGFCAYTSNSGAAIKFAGEVPPADTSVALAQEAYTWMGNASVANLTLADIVPNANFAAFGDNIQFCDAEGNWESQLTYASQAFMTENELEGYTVGWYRLSDEEMETCLNSTPVPAGKAFCAYSSNSGAAITIPTPMPPAN